MKFTENCLKQSNKLTCTHGKVVNTLKGCLFGAITFTKNADIDKYKYSGYGIGFDRRSIFSFSSGGFGQNKLIFVVDMSSSAHC